MTHLFIKTTPTNNQKKRNLKKKVYLCILNTFFIYIINNY